MKKIIFLFCMLLGIVQNLSAQSYNQDNRALQNYIERMYKASPFEGCRFIDDYDKTYFISVVALNSAKYKSQQNMNRVAEVKSQQQSGEFFNGTQSFSEFVIKTPRSEQNGNASNIEETIDVIKTNSTGYIRQMQVLTSFVHNNSVVFIYCKEVTSNKNK